MCAGQQGAIVILYTCGVPIRQPDSLWVLECSRQSPTHTVSRYHHTVYSKIKGSVTMDAGIPSVSSHFSLLWHHGSTYGSAMQFPSCPVGGVSPFRLQKVFPSVYKVQSPVTPLELECSYCLSHYLTYWEEASDGTVLHFQAWGRSIYCPFIANGTEVGEGARLGLLSCWSGSFQSIDHLTLALLFFILYFLTYPAAVQSAMRCGVVWCGVQTWV